ncbi:eukaryotic translation initiation factor 3 subunit J-like [Artemia franciscana]|uniref:eukaryotic translation initiation factor 3 subunit J-like n=1 Tax=Artemia franciscana TaxID=6661 RepID=UPI0032DA856F
MADDWENEDFEPPPVPVPRRVGDKWEGEDEDEPVKDSWEDEEAEEKPAEPKIPETKISKKKKLEQKIAEKEQKKYHEESRRLQNGDEDEEDIDLTPEERLAEKLRKQKLQEESDLLMARETFGLDDVAPSGVVDSLNPSNPEEFLIAKDALVNKIKDWQSRPGYNDFVEGLIRDLCTSLDVDPLKKISLVTKAFYEEKLKLTKPPKGKAKGKKVATLKLDKDNTYYDEDYGGDYDDFM